MTKEQLGRQISKLQFDILKLLGEGKKKQAQKLALVLKVLKEEYEKK